MNKRLRELEEQNHQNQQFLIEIKRESALAKEDQICRERESQMMRDLYEKLTREIDEKNKHLQMKLEDQEKRGRELEEVVLKVQKLEHGEVNRLKRVLHEKVVSDRERGERDEEKARVLFQELARLGMEIKQGTEEESGGRREMERRLAQIENRINEERKR